MALHTVAVTAQRVCGKLGEAVTLTIGLPNGESITTLIKHYPYNSDETIAETQDEANRNALWLFQSLKLSAVNEVRLFTEHNPTRAQIFDSALVPCPESVDRYFAVQGVRP